MYVDSLDASPSEEHALNDWDLGIGNALGIDTDKWLKKQKSDAINNFTDYAEKQIDNQIGSFMPNESNNATVDKIKDAAAGIGVLSMDELQKRGLLPQNNAPASTEESKVTEYAKKLNHPATYGVLTFAGAKWVAKFGWITSIALGGAAAGAKIFYDKSQENKQ